MARNIDDIERDIERTRGQLAGTLDELAERSKPQNIMDNTKRSITEKLQDPTVQKVLAGVGVAVVAVVGFGIVRNRKRAKDIQDLKKALASRR